MEPDIDPRPEFTRSLREWFVAELDERRDGDTEPSSAASTPPAPELGHERATGSRRARRWWLLLANAAVVVGLLVGAAWLRQSTDDSTADEPVVTVPVPPPDPVDGISDICANFRTDAVRLPLGATAAEVERVAVGLRQRLVDARAQLTELAPESSIDQARALADEAIAAAERLQSIADGSRGEIDTAVSNLDLIVLAWGRELEGIAGSACAGLPTLREVF